MNPEEFDLKVYDNKIEITPKTGVKDNSVYEITVRGLVSEDRTRRTDEFKTQITTKLTPSYCSLHSVKSLADEYDLADDKILFFIREASLFAEYIRKETYDEENVPFEVKQYVKYRAVYESLLKHYVGISSQIGMEGALGEVSFANKVQDNALKELLKAIKNELDQWTDHLKGFGLEGRAAPTSTIRGSLHRPIRPTIPAFNIGFNGGSFARGGDRR